MRRVRYACRVTSAWRKLGVIAGGGELPVVIAEYCARTGLDYFVARISPFASDALAGHPGASHSLGAMGARIAAMQAAGVDALVLVGKAPRPDLRALELDDGARAMLPALLAAAPQGDDALLRAVLSEHERAGFRVVGVAEAAPDLLAAAGVWGAHAPGARALQDILRAAEIAAAIGRVDVGQAVVVCEGLALAVEAQEGTDAMLKRVGELPETVRGRADARRGVLVKRPKPIQERRIDLPVVGVRTVELAAAAGLAGIAVEAGAALVVRRDTMIAAADAAGLFLYGFDAGDVAPA